MKYSIIIPHYNIPQLLQRCLKTIPVRDDIQVIVVDNNSNTENRIAARKVCDQFPQVEYIQDEVGNGAGHARNIGLEHVKGEWLIFSDADDYFYIPFWKNVDDYIKDTTADLIFFRSTCVDSDTLEPANRGMYNWDKLIRNYINHNKDSENELRYLHIGPMSKLFRYRYIVDNSIRFDETYTANDVMFCIYAGAMAKKIEAHDELMYIITQRKGSLTTLKDKQSLRCRYEVKLRRNQYLNSKNLSYYSSTFPSFLINALTLFGIKELLWYLNKMIEYKVNPFWGYSRIVKNKIFHNK